MRRCVRQVVVLFAAFLLAQMASGGAPGCPGDCDGDGRVAINELVLAVGIALGRSPLESCPAADSVVDGTVRINELIAAVRSALDGCPAAETPTPDATTTPTSTPLDVSPTANTPTPTTSDTPTSTPLDVSPTANTPTPTTSDTPTNTPLDARPASLVGSWTLRRVDQPSSNFNFFLLTDGSVMRPFAGRAEWGKIGTWSVSGNTLLVERCPEPNLESFELTATWTPDAELDEFGIRSCPQSQQGPCPAIRGTFTFFFTNGTSLPSWEVDSAGGFTSDARYDDLFGIDWQDCHGACGEHWSNIFGAPRPCGPL